VTRRPLLALAVCAACALAAIVVWWLAFRTSAGLWVDAAVLTGFTGLRGPRTEPLAQVLSSLVDLGPFTLLCALLVGIALVRGRSLRALAVGVVLLGANVTTQLLKPALAEVRPHPLVTAVLPEAWPSGHATASMSLALCLVWVAPRALRPLAAAVGGLFVVAVVDSILLLAWHYPSDVAAGFCVAGAWTAAGVAAVWALEGRPAPARRPLRPELAVAPSALAAVGLAGLGLAIVLARPDGAIAYAQEHTAFVAGAAAIAAGALALAASFAALLSR
jgi:membrane-associated phospholipid phosphatase